MDFGFTLSPSSSIDLSKLDYTTYEHLLMVEPTAAVCMNCGSCGATCTVSSYKGMSVRKLLTGLQRGQDMHSMLSSCMLCGKCSMVCPRGVNTRHILLTLCQIYD